MGPPPSPPAVDTRAVIARLAAAGCVLPDAEVAEALRAWADAPPGELTSRLGDYARRRELGEPPAYILGGTRFLGAWVRVGPGAFIPRPWTAAVARHAIEHLEGAMNVVDAGTGAGPIALALAAASPATRVWATEVDPGALAWARLNLGALPNVTVIEGDLLSALPPSLLGQVDLVAGCLPYVPTEAMAQMPRDFRDHEPAVAFDGGADGLRPAARLLAEAPGWLRPGGRVVLEIGAGQGDAASALCDELGYVECVVARDADGDEAMITARRSSTV